MARAGIRGLLITTEVVAPAAIRRLMRLVSAAARHASSLIDTLCNVADLGSARAAADGVIVNVLVDVDVPEHGARASRSRRAGAGAGRVPRSAQPALRFRGLQGYAGHCAHVMGWESRREASHAALKPLMETREADRAGRPARRLSWPAPDRHLGHRRRLAGLTELQCRLLPRHGRRLPAHRREGGGAVTATSRWR